MISSILSEGPISLSAAGEHAGLRNASTGKPCKFVTVWRKCVVGAKSVSGEKIKLEAIKTPAGLRTSMAAIDRFIAALNGCAATLPPSAKRRQRVEHAKAKLAANGI